MKAIERRIRLVVTIDTITIGDNSFDMQLDEIRERIQQHIAGHRTEKRLADHCEVSEITQVSETMRELP